MTQQQPLLLAKQEFNKARKTDPASRIRNLISEAEPQFQRAFLQAIDTIKSNLKLNRLADLIQSGNFEEAIRIIASVPEALAAISSSVVVAAGASTADIVSDVVGELVSFDQTNVRAVNRMRANRLRLVTNFTNEQRVVTRQALVEGITRGVNPRETARVFRDSIGLTQRQLRAVENYRLALQNNSLAALNRELRDRRFDSTVLSAIENKQPLSNSEINRMVDRYRERQLKFRSETIARTEALRAVHQGTEEMYEQAFDNGTLNRDDLSRKWVTARDGRVRDSHDGMNGQERKFGETFVSDSGNALRYPGDENAPANETIQCRCVITTRFS